MRRLLTMCAALTVVGAFTISAHAGWMNTGPDVFVGNSYFQDASDNNSGFVSVAVYDNSDNSFSAPAGVVWADQLGNAPPKFPASLAGANNFDSDYIYFYQVVNAVSGLETVEISALGIPISGPSIVKSAGYIAETVFSDDETPSGVGSVGNDALGDDIVAPFVFTEYTGSVGFESAPAPGTDNFTIPVDEIGFTTGGSILKFSFDSDLADGFQSTVFFFTSNVAPSFNSTAMLFDGGHDSMGVTVTPTPVPAGLALLFTGLPGVLGMFFWRRKQAVAA